MHILLQLSIFTMLGYISSKCLRRKYKMLQYSCVKSVIMCDNNAARSELISLELPVSPESQPNC